jgi:hypothetical protein
MKSERYESLFADKIKKIAKQNHLEYSEDFVRLVTITTKKDIITLKEIFRDLRDPNIHCDFMKMPKKWAGGPNQKGLFFANDPKVLKSEMDFVKTSIKLMGHLEILIGEIRTFGGTCFIIESQNREKIHEVLFSIDIDHCLQKSGDNGTFVEYWSTSHNDSELKAAKLVETKREMNTSITNTLTNSDEIVRQCALKKLLENYKSDSDGYIKIKFIKTFTKSGKV